MSKWLLILFVLSPFIVLAQQEKAESNNDLRFGKKVFVYRNLKKKGEYAFSKKSNGESYLSSIRSGFVKLSNVEESTFEPGVVNLFIKIKYQLAEYKKKCKKDYYLGYLGDEVYICSEDQARKPLIQAIKNQFENIIKKAKR